VRRHKFQAVADDDTLPVMVPRNDKAALPISRERVRRLCKHLIVTFPRIADDEGSGAFRIASAAGT
jgi:hypothetical protein